MKTMRKILFSVITFMCFVQFAKAQPATYSNPLGIGRNNCAGSGGVDSLYYLNYLSPNLSNSLTPITACRPVLRTNFAPLSGYSAANKPFTIFNSSIAFNPADSICIESNTPDICVKCSECIQPRCRRHWAGCWAPSPDI